HQFDLHLGQEVDDVFGSPVKLGMAFLAAEALGLGHRDALEPNLVERFFDFIELERLDDRFDFFHRFPAGSRLLAGPVAEATTGRLQPEGRSGRIPCESTFRAKRYYRNG